MQMQLPQRFLINKYLQFIYSNFSDMTERFMRDLWVNNTLSNARVVALEGCTLVEG
jgi:hypothetical protein